MQVALAARLYEQLPIEEVFTRARKLTYEAIEISGQDWRARWPWPAVREAARRHQMTVCSVHCNHADGGWDAETGDSAFRAYHEVFYDSLRGGNGLVVVEHCGRQPFDRVDAREIARARLLRAMAAERGLVTAFENRPEGLCTVENVLQLVEGAEAKWVFNPAHASAAGVNPVDFVPLFGELANVYATDWIGDLPLGLWVPCGLGTLDWAGLLRDLSDSGYTGPVTVELDARKLREIIAVCQKAVPRRKLPAFDDEFARCAREFLEHHTAEAIKAGAGRKR